MIANSNTAKPALVSFGVTAQLSALSVVASLALSPAHAMLCHRSQA